MALPGIAFTARSKQTDRTLLPLVTQKPSHRLWTTYPHRQISQITLRWCPQDCRQLLQERRIRLLLFGIRRGEPQHPRSNAPENIPNRLSPGPTRPFSPKKTMVDAIVRWKTEATGRLVRRPQLETHRQFFWWTHRCPMSAPMAESPQSQVDKRPLGTSH